MGSKQGTADYILEQLADARVITAKKMFGDYTEGRPYSSAKPHLLISGDQWEDDEWLSQLIKITAAELPVPILKK